MGRCLSPRAFVEDRPVDDIASTASLRSTDCSWNRLDAAHRLEAIEHALLAANDRIDGYPIAL